jgi:hypothetical protein
MRKTTSVWSLPGVSATSQRAGDIFTRLPLRLIPSMSSSDSDWAQAGENTAVRQSKTMLQNNLRIAPSVAAGITRTPKPKVNRLSQPAGSSGGAES